MSHYKPYPAYKDSGVEWIGLVPEHWKVAQIKRISALNPKKSTLSEEKDSLCTFLPMEKLRTNAITLDETRPIHEVYDGYSYFCDDDILIAKVTPCFENGNIAVANGLVNGIGFGSTEINVLRVNGKGHNRFLYYRLQEEQFRTIAKSEMRGTGGLKRVPTELFESFTFGLPDTDEQVTIAATLDRETSRIDALIQKKTRFIDLLKEKRQALITHAVTKGLDPNVKMKDSGVEWIGQVPEEWKTGKLKHLGTLKGGSGFPTDMQGQPDNELPFYKVGDLSKSRDNISLNGSSNTISRKDAKELGATVFPENTISWAKIGAALFLNRRRISNTACCLDNNMTGFVVDSKKVPIQYAFYLMNAIDFSFFARPGAVPSLSEGEQSAIPIAIPSYEESFSIAATLERETARIDALIGKAEHSITLLKERRAAFITAAVTGQIDLRGEQ